MGYGDTKHDKSAQAKSAQACSPLQYRFSHAETVCTAALTEFTQIQIIIKQVGGIAHSKCLAGVTHCQCKRKHAAAFYFRPSQSEIRKRATASRFISFIFLAELKSNSPALYTNMHMKIHVSQLNLYLTHILFCAFTANVIACLN